MHDTVVAQSLALWANVKDPNSRVGLFRTSRYLQLYLVVVEVAYCGKGRGPSWGVVQQGALG